MGKVDYLSWRRYALYRVPFQLIHVIAFINIIRCISKNIVYTWLIGVWRILWRQLCLQVSHILIVCAVTCRCAYVSLIGVVCRVYMSSMIHFICHIVNVRWTSSALSMRAVSYLCRGPRLSRWNIWLQICVSNINQQLSCLGTWSGGRMSYITENTEEKMRWSICGHPSLLSKCLLLYKCCIG